jgi:flagellar hook-length control protein FliK
VNSATPTVIDTGGLTTLLPVAAPAALRAGLRGSPGEAPDPSQLSDFASFISIIAGSGMQPGVVPAIPGLAAPPVANDAPAGGAPESLGPPAPLKLLMQGGIPWPPAGSALPPPGVTTTAVTARQADKRANATLATLTDLQNVLPASAATTASSEALAATAATATNENVMAMPWLRALQSGERGPKKTESLLTESAEAVTAGDTPLAATAGARDTPQTTPVVCPTSPAQQPAFEQALGERLAWLVQEGRHDARIKLHPAELGSIDIRLSMDGDSTRISLASPHAAVRDALEQAVPRLRELLGQSGLDLSQVNVGAGDARSRGDFARPSWASASGHDSAAFAADAGATSAAIGLRLPQGLVDTFA